MSLYILSKIEFQHILIDVKQVLTVLPCSRLVSYPVSDSSMAGLLEYRDKLIPTLDLKCALLSRKSVRYLDTRLIVLRSEGDLHAMTALLVERVLGTEIIQRDDLADSSEPVLVRGVPALVINSELLIQRSHATLGGLHV